MQVLGEQQYSPCTQRFLSTEVLSTCTRFGLGHERSTIECQCFHLQSVLPDLVKMPESGEVVS